MKVYNFAAGPSAMPEEVKLAAQKDFFDYGGSGMSAAEMSHRSVYYDEIHNEAMELFRKLAKVPDNFYVLFLQGGATLQFEAVPLNLLVKGRADYVVTGNFAAKAYKEALKFGDVLCVASSEDDNFRYIPDVDKIPFRNDADYVHITGNNTIFGTKYTKFPEVDNLVADLSSMILSEPIDMEKFSLIYAGAQKNIGIAGLTVVAVKKDIIGSPMKICPTIMKYSTHANANSLYNTPPTFSVYMAMLNMRWLDKIGGVEEIYKINKHKASILYDFIDNSSFYRNSVRKTDRSLMNIPFFCPSKELDARFVKEASQKGLVSLKGHRLVGGMRASVYNAMPVEGVEALIGFMKKFETENRCLL